MSSGAARALRIGTRASKLARWQAEWVAERIRAGGSEVELIDITTHGDAEQASPIGDIGTLGVFTKEIQRALLSGDVDLAVHSLKDLPTESVAGLMLAAVPERESAADVLVGAGVSRLEAGGQVNQAVLSTQYSVLPRGARVGTGSLRRQAQLLHARPDLRVESVRGNVDTRLRKLDEGTFDAIVLAEAGLRRLGLAKRITQVLPPDVMLPAVGQGALAIECRAGDAKSQATAAALEDWSTRMSITAERALLAHLRGGCLAPIGAWGRIEAGMLRLSAAVLSADGAQRLEVQQAVAARGIGDATSLGRRVADELLSQGAADLIAAVRRTGATE